MDYMALYPRRWNSRFIWLRIGLDVGSCECSNETSGSTGGEGVLEQQSEYQLPNDYIFQSKKKKNPFPISPIRNHTN
jgi:hypothetical protein